MPKATDFDRRFDSRRQELSQLYGELYQGDSAALDDFLEMLRRCWRERKRALRDQDRRREADPGWYRRRDMLGMMLYVNAFAGSLGGVEEKLPYLRECGVNYLHRCPCWRAPRDAATAAMPSATSGLSSPSWGPWRIWSGWPTPAAGAACAFAWTL